MVRQSRPLSYSYGSIAANMHAMNQTQTHFEMPDPNDFIRSTVSRRSGRNSFHPSQLISQPPPYPLHDRDEGISSEHMVYRSRSASIRQPTPEDFLPKRRPLPAWHSLSPQPVWQHHFDQGQPVTVPDSQTQKDSCRRQHAHTTNPQPANLNAHKPKRHSEVSAPKSTRVSRVGAMNKRSQPERRPNSNASSGSSQASSSRRRGRAQPIGSDMYQPTLGGLHNISDLKRKDSKCDRVKRAMSKLNPLRRQRRSWD